MLPELVVWTDPGRAFFCGRWMQGLAELVRPIAVGGPRCSEVEALAQQCQVTADDDLRRMLTNHPPGFLLWAGSQTPSPTSIEVALAHDTTLLLLEPLAGDLVEWGTFCPRDRTSIHKPPVPVYLPTFLQSPGWLSAADPLEALGPPRTLLFTSHGRPGQSSLFMRLMDAWLTLGSLTDLPETIHASLLASPEQVPFPADLRRAQGHLQMHARLPDGRGILVQVSDQAGVTARQLIIISEQAHLQVTDHAYQLHDLQGRLLDQHRPDPEPLTTTDPWLALCMMQARRRITATAPPPTTGTRDLSALALACCQAAWLSCRTGQPESPREMLRIHPPLERV